MSLAEFARRIRDLGGSDGEIEAIMDDYVLLLTGVVSVDEPVARTAFVIGCRTPVRLPLIDALIAAAALANRCVLVHRDERMRAIPPELISQSDVMRS